MTRRRTARDFQRQSGGMERRVRHMVRRMLVTASQAVRWSLRGHTDENGGHESARAEMFSNVGFASRPASAGAEAIVVTVEAAANHQVIVATRDRTAERAVVELAGLEPGETLLFNTSGPQRMIKLTASGDILIGAPGGEFKAVALAGHTHAPPPVTGQAQYADPDPRTGPPDKVSEDVRVT